MMLSSPQVKGGFLSSSPPLLRLNQKLGKLSLFLNVPQSYDNMLFRSEWKYTTFNMLCCNALSVLVSVLMQQPHLQKQHKTPKSQMIQTITCLQLISPAFRNSCNTFFPFNLTSFTIIFQLKTEDIFFLNTLINLQFMPGYTCIIYFPPYDYMWHVTIRSTKRNDVVPETLLH